MHRAANHLHLTVPFPLKDHRTFVSATRILGRVMGKKAPSTLTLIQHNLTGRDPEGIAEDYLDFIGWPDGQTSRAAPKDRKSATAKSKRPLAAPMRLLLLRLHAPVEPGRNLRARGGKFSARLSDEPL